MSNGFDVYHKWLSIPPSEQPPNHYRLLGLELFECDPDVISSAADRQMAHVQTYKNGPHAAQSQKLLNEIAAAKLCLLKPAKRDVYDAELRQRLAAKQPMLTSASVPPASATAAFAAAAGARPSSLPPPPIAAPPQLGEFGDGETQRPLFGTAAVLTAGSVLILLLIIAIVAILRSGQKPQSSSENDPTTHPADNLDNAASNGNANIKTVDPSALPVPRETAVTLTIPPAKPDPAEKPLVTPPVVPPNPSIEVKIPDPLKKPDKSPADPNVKPMTDPATVKPPAPDPATPKKLLVPDGTAESAAKIRFTETFAAASPQAILDKSQTLSDGPLVYVALRKALDAGLNAGDVALVSRIVDELSRRFTIETVPLRAKAYNDLRQHVTTTAGWEALAEAALALVDEAVAANHADLALPLAETSLVAARKSGNLELVRKVTLRVLLLQEQGSGPAKGGARVGS
jgi:hypothetical protein